MPFRPSPFLKHFERLRRLRVREAWAGYAIAAAGVGVAIGARAALAGFSAPFVTFYPAVIVATFAAGMRAGVFSILLSALAADFFFIAPVGSLALSAIDAATLAAFVLVAMFLVATVTLLNEAVDQLWAQSQKVEFVLESEPAAVIAIDADGRIELVNRRAEEMFGYRRDELYGKPIEVLVPEDAREAHVRLRKAFLSRPVERAMGANRDLHGRRSDGSAVPIEVGLSPLDVSGVKGALATVIDISERKIMERRQEILTNEVRHRSRNLLMVVRAIATQTIAPAARADFLAALDSLARTQDLFLKTGAASLAQIVQAELAPFHNRVSVSGCETALSPRAAQDFALILHELATNSAKHGALSLAEGRVLVSGIVEEETLAFTWDEQGGPAARDPARKGFGQTILIEMPKVFATLVEARYGAAGFQYELRCPLSAITSNVLDLADRRSG